MLQGVLAPLLTRLGNARLGEQQISNSFLAAEGRSAVVAVSGGPDSMALLHLLSSSSPAVSAFTVEHALREESADEAAFVSKYCKMLGALTTSLSRVYELTRPSQVSSTRRGACHGAQRPFQSVHGTAQSYQLD